MALSEALDNHLDRIMKEHDNCDCANCKLRRKLESVLERPESATDEELKDIAKGLASTIQELFKSKGEK